MTSLFLLPLSFLFYVHITNYLKGLTTNERFGRGSHTRKDSEFSQENTELLQRLKTSSTLNKSDPHILVRKPTSKGNKLQRAITQVTNEDNKPFDVQEMMRKMRSKEFKHMDQMGCGNCVRMCGNTQIYD
jgi:hypothetical protein